MKCRKRNKQAIVLLIVLLMVIALPSFGQVILQPGERPQTEQQKRPVQRPKQSEAQIFAERARRLEIRGDYEQALANWLQVASREPWDEQAIQSVPRMLLLLKRNDEAEKFLTDLLAKSEFRPNDPMNPLGPSSTFGLKLELGRVRLAQENEAGAWAIWNEALTEQHNSPDAMRGLVNTLQQARRWEDSEKLIRDYRSSTHNPAFMSRELASSLQAQMNFAGATEELLLYAETSPTAWQVTNSYMNRFPDDSTVVDKVLEVLDKAIRKDRQNGSLLRIYANYTLKAGLLEESLTATIEADPLIKGGGMLVLQAAQSMLKENAVDLARRGFQQVIDWNPPANSGMAEQAELGLGNCFEALGQYEEAKTAYTAFIANHPQSNEQEEARYRVANILLNQERNAAEALTMFKGIWIRGRGAQKVIAGVRIGDCHAWMQEFDQAISAWGEVVALSRKEMSPEAAEAMLRIARANIWRDSTNAALTALDSVMNGNTMNSAFNDAIMYSAMLEEGGFYRAVRSFAEGDYALFMQQNEQAAEDFSVAAGLLKYGKMAEWSRFQQAIALRQAGQPEAAISVLDTFITNYPESVDLDRAEYTQAVIRADDLKDMQGALDRLQKFLIEHPRSLYLEQARRKARIISNQVS